MPSCVNGVWRVSNQRVHGTTHERVDQRLAEEQLRLQPIAGRLPYPYVDEELRRVARDAYVSWESNRYSVPWTPMLVHQYGFVNMTIRLKSITVASVLLPTRVHRVNI